MNMIGMKQHNIELVGCFILIMTKSLTSHSNPVLSTCIFFCCVELLPKAEGGTLPYPPKHTPNHTRESYPFNTYAERCCFSLA